MNKSLTWNDLISILHSGIISQETLNQPVRVIDGVGTTHEITAECIAYEVDEDNHSLLSSLAVYL